MGGIFSTPKVPPPPPIQPPAPLPTPADESAAKRKALKTQAARRGRASTILSRGDEGL